MKLNFQGNSMQYLTLCEMYSNIPMDYNSATKSKNSDVFSLALSTQKKRQTHTISSKMWLLV